MLHGWRQPSLHGDGKSDVYSGVIFVVSIFLELSLSRVSEKLRNLGGDDGCLVG